MITGPGRWTHTATALGLPVACEGGRHTVRWAGGVLELCDHPELDAERALVAFGGVEPVCLGLLTLWEEAVADGGFLAEWVDEHHLDRARLSWLTMALERLRNEGFHEFLRDLPPARAERMGRFVVSFPRPFLDRAAATFAKAVTEGAGVRCSRAASLIPAAVAARLRRSFVAAVGGRQLSVGAAALVPLRISVATGPPAVTGTLGGAGRGVELAVEPTWLHRVWAAGAAVVEGHLVLGLRPAGGPEHGSVTASVVVWEASDGGSTPRLEPLGVTHDGNRWLIGR